VELSLDTEAVSFGYISDAPITTYADEPPTEIKMYVNLTRFSTELGNYQSDPLSGLLASYQTTNQEIKSLNNSQLTPMYEVSKIFTSDGELIRYYSQKKFNNDVYLIYFELSAEDVEKVFSIVDAFKWSI
jgi:hypothetical protein